MGDNDVAVIAVLLIFGAPIAAWVISRVLAHRERIEMIRHGSVPPPPGVNPWTGPSTTRFDWRADVPPPTAQPAWYPNENAQRQLQRGIRLTCIGLALTIGLSFIGPLAGTPFGPWLLGGLVPMFVGIAQIINAVLSGARVPTFGAMPPPMGGSQAPPPADSTVEPPGVHPSSHGWRPGPTPSIPKPPAPPDFR